MEHKFTMDDVAFDGDSVCLEPLSVTMFRIDSLDKANWAIAKIARAEARRAEREAAAKVYIDRIRAWVDSANKSDIDTADRLTELLRPWAEVEIAKAGKVKHVKLLGGEIGYRQAPKRLDITDEAAALAAVPESCKRVKVEIDKTAVKALIETTGEIPAGCDLVAGEIRWYVKTDLAALPGGAPELPA